MIFAADENGAIGKDGDLPWRQSSDLQYFKQLTLDKTIVMGRKTWESLPGKLPRRRHLVMSRGTINEVEQTSVNEVLELANDKKLLDEKLKRAESEAVSAIKEEVSEVVFEAVSKSMTSDNIKSSSYDQMLEDGIKQIRK